MDLSFYTAAVGVQMQQERLNVHADNIANVNNYAFRARIPAFSSLMTGPVKAIERDMARGVGSKLEDSEMDLTSTLLSETGSALDFAIEGKGFFALLDMSSNQISYTRDGSFIMSKEVELDANGVPIETDHETWYLTDGNGRYVLGMDGQRIEVPPHASTAPVGLEINVGIFDFINHNGMLSYSENRLLSLDKNGRVSLGTGKLLQGYLEENNTDLAHEISKVIESQRSFQYMLRMVTTSDEIETTVNGLR